MIRYHSELRRPEGNVCVFGLSVSDYDGNVAVPLPLQRVKGPFSANGNHSRLMEIILG